MVSYLSHAWRMTYGTEHCSSFLPGMNSPPQVNYAITNFDPQALHLAIGPALQGKLNLLAQ
jgi:hypothetical protein